MTLVRMTSDYKRPAPRTEQPKFVTNSAEKRRQDRELRALEKALAADREAAMRDAEVHNQQELLVMLELRRAQEEAVAEVFRRQQLRAQLNELLLPHAGQPIERLALAMADRGDLVDAIMMLHEIKFVARIIKDVLEARRFEIESMPFTPGDFLADHQLVPVHESLQFRDWLKRKGIRGGNPERRRRLSVQFCAEMGWEYAELM